VPGHGDYAWPDDDNGDRWFLTADFLLWRHPTKVARFVCLTELLREESLEDVVELRAWLKPLTAVMKRPLSVARV
jgi:hypothetical protein